MANLRVDKITSTETFETTGSVQFDGNSDWLDIASSNDFAYGTGDFTWEAWFYPAAVKTTHYIFDHGNDGGVIQFYDGIIRYYNSTIGVNNILYTGGGTLNYSSWSHIAVSRNSGISRLFVNGQLKCLGPDAHSYSAQAVTIGDYGANSGTNKAHGFISNARLIKGKALYTANFKPPMRELEVTPETVLLACQSKTDASLEKTGKTITVNGTAAASELTPGILTPVVKSGGGSAITGSVEFNGAPAATVGTDYLNVSSTDFAFGTSDFSVEMWFNSGDVSSAGQRGLIQLSDTVGGLKTNYTSGFVISTGVNNAGSASDNNVNCHILGDELGSNTAPLKNDSWHHVALTRQSGTARLFLNGVLLGSSSAAESISAEHLVIGGWYSTSYLHKGFISNLRIVRGTALYTDNFTPPTRELKKIPGTVLLCCQDPDNPLTEATGKTITGYGSLQREDGVELITNGTFNSDVSNWTATDCTLTYSSGQMQVTRSGGGGLTANQAFTTVAGNKYNLSGTINSSGSRGDLRVYNGSGTGGSMIVSLSGTSGAVTDLRGTFIASSTTSTVVIAIDNNSTSVTVDNISVTLAEGSNKGSNFTPQVGDDRKVTFEGVTKVNSDAYFYLPTGDTASREATGSYSAGTRGIFGGSFTPASSQDMIEYINIATLGDSKDFGNLTQDRYGNGALASGTRALWAAGLSAPNPTSYYNIIDYVTIMSTGNAQDFGDLTYGVPYYTAGVSNATRGIWGGGYNTPSSPLVPSPFPNGFQDEMEYVTIASKGNGVDFGDFTARNSFSSYGSPTRGVFSGGATPTRINTIEYITISTTGNAQDFGDMTVSRNYGAGVSNSIRGIVAGGYDGVADAPTNVISYNTIASMGNALDFGDLVAPRSELGGACSSTRGVIGGGWSPAKLDEMDYITIATTGNAVAFGELQNTGVYMECGTSNGHGGLG